jgi:hypothetical protein
MKHGKRIGVALAVLISVAVVSGIIVIRSDDKAPSSSSASSAHTTHIRDDATGTELDYNHKLVSAKQLTVEDTEDKFIVSLSDKPGSSTKPLLLTVRYEDGLATAAAITKQSVLDHLENSSKLALPQKDGYKLESMERIEIAGKEAIQIVFTYNAVIGTPTKQQLLIIPIDSDRAVYIAQQAKVEDYDSVNAEIFQPSIDSIKFN